MFGKNEIVGQKYFNSVPEDEPRLLITSIFPTLQGEGPFSGQPALFIRLAKCNLACGFCDTYFDGGEWMSEKVLVEKISDTLLPLWPSMPPDFVLVITGGEPMLQKSLVPILNSLVDVVPLIQIESNGTLLLSIPNEVYLVVSPKCSEKNGHVGNYLEPRAEVLDRADCLKFVMSSDITSPYAHIPVWAHDWHQETKRSIYISPMNVYARPPTPPSRDNLAERTRAETVSFWEEGLLDREANRANHEYAARYCLRHGFCLTLQQHLYAALP